MNYRHLAAIALVLIMGMRAHAQEPAVDSVPATVPGDSGGGLVTELGFGGEDEFGHAMGLPASAIPGRKWVAGAKVIVAPSEDGKQVFASSEQHPRWTPQELEPMEGTVAVPVVGEDVATVRHGHFCYAYSTKLGTWDVLKLPKSELAIPQVGTDSVTVHSASQGDFVYKNAWGKWFSTEEIKAGRVAEHLLAQQLHLERTSKVSEADLPQQDLSKRQSSNATDVTGEFLKQAIADFRQRVEDLDLQSHDLADKLKQPLKATAEAERLNVLLRDVVQKSFVTRQELRRAELELFAIRLRALKQSVETRDRIADKIIDRRIEELLDPNLSWESSSDAIPPVDVLIVSLPTGIRTFLRVDKSESNENIGWLVNRLAQIGIAHVNISHSGKPNILEILFPEDLPSDERSRLERQIKALEKGAPIQWIVRFMTASPPKVAPGNDLGRTRNSDSSAGPDFRNSGNGVGVPLGHSSLAGEQSLWNEYGVTPAPISDVTAKVLEAIGLHLSPISNKQFRGKNVLTNYSGGLDLTFVETGGPAEKAGIHEVDIVVVLQGQGVATLREFDVVVQDALKNFKSGTSSSLIFDVLRNGETVSVNVPLPDGALALTREEPVSEDLKLAQRRLEICEASELSVKEAATLAKSESRREILYLRDNGQIIPLRRKPETLLNETDVVSAVAEADLEIDGAYTINLELKPEAAQRFAEKTRRLSQQTSPVRLAILVSGKIRSAPRLVSEILNGKMRITGKFTREEAEQLAADLIRDTDRPVLAPVPTRSNEN